ncbi:MAG: hypothetical protein V4608_03775 [Bacteroidota bacterium]
MLTSEVVKSVILNTNYFFDLETSDGLVGTGNIKPAAITHSGKMACDLSGGKEYGPSVVKTINTITSQPLKKVSASVWVYPLTDNPIVVLTASVVNSKGEGVFWDGKGTEKQIFPKNKWTKINAGYNIPVEKITGDDELKINIWNKGKTDVIIDDIEIVYGENNERRGVYASIDPNVFYENRYIPVKNKPPFKMVFFQKQEISNNNSTFITPDHTNTLADLSPNDDFLTGNFIEDNKNLDEIICVKNKKCAFFQYDVEKRSFQEVLVTSVSGKINWDKKTKLFSGDFNKDGVQDVLIIDNKTGTWELFNLKNKNWVLVSEGASLFNESLLSPDSKPFVSSAFSDNNTDALIVLNSKDYFILQLNRQTNTFIKKVVSLPSADTSVFNGTSVIYTATCNNQKSKQFLKLDTDWRFDFKLISKDATGFEITNSIDFKGYSGDCNPKYYESVKIVSGKFINSETALIVMMRNCADVEFDGKQCALYENVAHLPNSTQLYILENGGR